MGKTYEALNDKLIDFVRAQKMFFVATAPLSADGHVNMSPKGYDSFKVLDNNTVAYLDLGGSGIETQAHIQENGRITIMFCAFEGPANIVRLYGTGEAIDFDNPEYPELLSMFPGHTRARAVIKIKVDRVSDSCGWGVPFYEFKGERDQLQRYVENPERSDEEWMERRRDANATSIDGLPGLIGPKD
ncbi:MAG: pyridoxamine 5'-phosphate oxidase family protein [Hyphomonas sp.]